MTQQPSGSSDGTADDAEPRDDVPDDVIANVRTLLKGEVLTCCVLFEQGAADDAESGDGFDVCLSSVYCLDLFGTFLCLNRAQDVMRNPDMMQDMMNSLGKRGSNKAMIFFFVVDRRRELGRERQWIEPGFQLVSCVV